MAGKTKDSTRIKTLKSISKKVAFFYLQETYQSGCKDQASEDEGRKHLDAAIVALDEAEKALRKADSAETE